LPDEHGVTVQPVHGCSGGCGRAAANYGHRIREPLAASIWSHVHAEYEVENRQSDAGDGLHGILRVGRAESTAHAHLWLVWHVDLAAIQCLTTPRILTTEVRAFPVRHFRNRNTRR
jgi:hypothetical protein